MAARAVGVGGAQGCEHLGTQARSPSLPLRVDSLKGTSALGKWKDPAWGGQVPARPGQGEGEDRVGEEEPPYQVQVPQRPLFILRTVGPGLPAIFWAAAQCAPSFEYVSLWPSEALFMAPGQ